MNTKEKKLLVAILILSVALRAATAVYTGNQVVELPGTADQVSYHNLALRILDGHGFTFGQDWWPATRAGEPTAHWSYLYTSFLVLVYSLFGPNPLVARLLQALLTGLLHPWLAYLIGRRTFGPSVGMVSAGLTAVYAYFIYYAATLMTEPFYITAILASLYLAMRLVDAQDTAPRWRLAAGLGLTLGAAVLLRQLFLLFVPFLFLWIVWFERRRWAPLVLSGAVLVLMILPFTAFNYARFNRFVLLNTNAGYAFFWGNHPIYGTQFIPILPSETYSALIPDSLRSLDEAALDQALLKEGLSFIVQDPGRYILLSLSRIPPYFMFWPSPDSGTISNLARVLSFGLLWPFMLAGLILAVLNLRRPASPDGPCQAAGPVILLIGFALVYTGIHLLTWTLIRYRLPVDAVLVCFAALALVYLFQRAPVLRRITGQVSE